LKKRKAAERSLTCAASSAARRGHRDFIQADHYVRILYTNFGHNAAAGAAFYQSWRFRIETMAAPAANPSNCLLSLNIKNVFWHDVKNEVSPSTKNVKQHNIKNVL
jgi:hypothetical protein